MHAELNQQLVRALAGIRRVLCRPFVWPPVLHALCKQMLCQRVLLVDGLGCSKSARP